MSDVDNKAWWLPLLPLLAATVAVGTDAWVVAGFLPQLAAGLRVSTAAAGVSVTVFALAYALGAPVLASLTGGARPRRVIAVALVVLGLANGCCAVAAGMAGFLVGRLVAALAACVVTPAAGVLAARMVDERRRGRALALVIAGLTIATAVGVPLGSLLAQHVSWRTGLWLVTALAWVAALLIRITAPDPDPGPRHGLRDRLAPLRNPAVLAVLGLTSVGMAAAYVPYAYSSALLPPGHGGWLGAVLAGYGMGAVVGSLGSGALTDRIGSRRTLTTAYLLMAIALLALSARPAAPLVGIAAVAWGAASWMQTPPQQTRLLRLAPEHGAVVLGSNASALYLGVGLGNTLGSELLGSGATTMCLVAAGIAVLALAWNGRL